MQKPYQPGLDHLRHQRTAFCKIEGRFDINSMALLEVYWSSLGDSEFWLSYVRDSLCGPHSKHPGSTVPANTLRALNFTFSKYNRDGGA